jgi:HSP20 family protein
MTDLKEELAMSLVKWRDTGALSPWSALRDLETHMNRLFKDSSAMTNWPAFDWAPAADLRETADAYHLDVDVPGLKKEEIELSVVDNYVTIKGERKHEKKEEKEGYHLYERHYGSFHRSFEIAGGFDPNKIEARYDNGVLHLTIPKREETKPKQIEVKVN